MVADATRSIPHQKWHLVAGVVATGLKMIDASSGISYTAILTDCQMPETDGYNATQATRQHEAAAMVTPNTPEPIPVRIPIIAPTANALQSDRAKWR